MKYVLLIVVVLVVLALIKAKARGRVSSRRTPDGAAGPQPMVACAHCGLHLPRAEAVSDAGGRLFCSEAHRLAGSDRP